MTVASLPANLNSLRLHRGTPVIVTRPNNVVAYAANQIWGDAVDARIPLVVPAAPADAAIAFNGVSFQIVNTRNKTDAAFTVMPIPFMGTPVTVLGDQAAVAIADADIPLIFPIVNNSGWPSWPASNVANTPGQLNNGAGVLGRRVLNFGGFSSINSAVFYAPGATVTIYFVITAAYVPVALEQILLVPYWQYIIL